jgi:crossover junction endodeoxyribonuclease RuvC
MRLLGIDPGFDRTGVGIVDYAGGKMAWVWHGCIQTSAKDSLSVRLQQVRDGLKQVLERAKPDAAVVERLFFQKNVTTALDVGMARGIALLAIADAHVSLIELTPNQVKQGIAGYGAADKRQVQEMVQRLLKLKEIPKPDDAADALALAIVGGPIAQTMTLPQKS